MRSPSAAIRGGTGASPGYEMRSGSGGVIATRAHGLSLIARQSLHSPHVTNTTPYAGRDFVASGGPISYAAGFLDQYRQAAKYVDRISRARSRPTCQSCDVPNQSCDVPKFELVLNQNRQGAWGPNSAECTRPRGRGDRIERLLCCDRYSRFWHFSDVARCPI
jgi:hypothetical protein